MSPRAVRLTLHIVVTLVYTVIFTHLIFGGYYGDWNAHIAFAADMLGGQWEVVHAGFHFTIIGIAAGNVALLPAAALVVAVVSVNAMLYLLTHWFKRDGAVWAGACLIAAPVSVFTPNHLYYGYIGFNSLHSPTMVLLRPLALAVFAVVGAVLTDRLRLAARHAAAVIVLCIGSTFVKPSFALAVVPALALVAGWRIFRRCLSKRFMAWGALIGGALITTLVAQYVIQYLWIDGESGGIVIAPLVSMLSYDPSALSLLAKACLSIAFPLTVVSLYPRSLSAAPTLQFAWVLFAVSAAYMYGLSETGARAGDGNFGWTGQIAALALFAASTVYWRTYGRGARWRYWVTLGVFSLHIVSGVAYLALRLLPVPQYVGW